MAAVAAPLAHPWYGDAADPGVTLGPAVRPMPVELGGPQRALQATPSRSATPTRTRGLSACVDSPLQQATSAATAENQSINGPLSLDALKAALRASLEEEAELEAAVAQRRSVAVMQASRIAALERSTAALLRGERSSANADLAEPDSESEPDEQPVARGPEPWSTLSLEDSDPPSARINLSASEEDAVDEGGSSLEMAAAQVVSLQRLRQQVACLEEELETRDAEVSRLKLHVGRGAPETH